ncbi:protein jagged-1-like [Mercenaria mercenaria]|uniref:protein jagged-1-like n=1 Tax=Mercenaria mercenaria TaxID=6596 RepID=UPI00234FA363|nr:protein jagged-1-like [Mercenaria mercenaria]
MLPTFYLLIQCLFLVDWKLVSASGLCESYPCLNNGVCTDTSNGYECDCHKGYSGEHCEDGGIIEVSETDFYNFAQFETNQAKLYKHCLRPLNNFKFSVRTERDAHVLLQTSADDFETSETNYVVYIDGWGGTRTVIVHDREVRLDISGLLSEYEYRDFWVSWNDTTISVGKGDKVGSEVFITYTDKPRLMEIKGVSFGTAWYTAADWKFPKALNECDVDPCDHCKVCVDGIYNYTCIE